MHGPAAFSLRWLCLSGVDQVETLFDALHAFVHTVEARGDAGILMFEDAKALFDLDHILGHALYRAANGAKMLKNKVVGSHSVHPFI
jgi:hypothetical protein